MPLRGTQFQPVESAALVVSLALTSCAWMGTDSRVWWRVLGHGREDPRPLEKAVPPEGHPQPGRRAAGARQRRRRHRALSHGGRQRDWTVAPLDLLPKVREIVGDRLALFMAGGVRRGTDMLKAVALGADAVFAGRAPVYGVCAGGAPGVERALRILQTEADESLGLLGVNGIGDLGRHLLASAAGLQSGFGHTAPA